MTATRTQPTPAAAEPARVELVDNWHVDWPKAIALIDRLGRRAQVGLDGDGWLAARRNLLVAFVGDEPAGHLSFRVDPVLAAATDAPADRRPRVEATVESAAVAVGFDADTIAAMLDAAARRRAADLNCVRYRTD